MPKLTTRLNITNCLNILRAENNLTQEELAKEIGVTRATIIAIEKGDYNPSLELAFRLALYFKTEIDKIFSIKETKE